MNQADSGCPPTDIDPLGKRLNLAARAARSMFDAQLRDADTTSTTWFVLLKLTELGPLIQRDLARELQIEAPTLVRKLDKLEADGLVTRRRSPTDRRAAVVELTVAGKKRYRTIRKRVEQIDADLSAVLTRDERSALEDMLDRLTRRARELHPRRRR